MSLPYSSLIIASRDRPELLADTVASVLKGNEVPSEIVIIDQSRVPHPSLGKLENVRNCEIRYLNVHTVGLSRGRNTGIAAARHENLALIDDDLYVDSGWFTNLMGALTQKGNQSVVSGQVLPYFENNNQGGFVPSTNVAENSAQYHGRINKDVLFAGNMAIFRSAFEKIGMFNERMGPGTAFPAGEDSDLGFRLLEAGFYIQYEPNAVVYHRAWRSNRDYIPLRWNYGLGRGAFYANHARLHDRYMLRRMLNDIRNHLLAFPFHFPRHRLQAFGDLVLSWGIVVGSIRWRTAEYKSSTAGKT